MKAASILVCFSALHCVILFVCFLSGIRVAMAINICYIMVAEIWAIQTSILASVFLCAGCKDGEGTV